MAERKRRVAYFYDPDVGQYYYGQGHPMKPHRVRMAHSLIMHSGLYNQMDMFVPSKATKEDMCEFHTDDYIDMLESAQADSGHVGKKQLLGEYNLLDDCPVFDGLFPYNQMAAGGTLGCAVKLNQKSHDVTINWSGGLHHGKKSEASGFCYVNDIVLGILELLKYHQRVLYIDIDVHHGDGVEEAFLTSDRVLTLSFHKFDGAFFPGTGSLENVGHSIGKYYSVNVPLKDGIRDEPFKSLFRPIVNSIITIYKPECIVCQCGADSLAHDRLGVFNLSSKGHASCVEYIKSFNIPLMLLGGGGYTIKNVARCWANETAVAVGEIWDDYLPLSDYLEYFSPEYEADVVPDPSKKDKNDEAYMQQVLERVMRNLSFIRAPSTGFEARHPDTPDTLVPLLQEEDGHPIISSPNRPRKQMWKHDVFS